MNSPILQTNIGTEARLDAIEMLLQQLVFFLEAEPGFKASEFSDWLSLVQSRMTATGSATQPQIAALAHLHTKVTP